MRNILREAATEQSAGVADSLGEIVEKSFQERKGEIFPTFGAVKSKDGTGDEKTKLEEPKKDEVVQEEKEEKNAGEGVQTVEEDEGAGEEREQVTELQSHIQRLEQELEELKKRPAQQVEKEELAQKEEVEEAEEKRPDIVNFLSEDEYDEALSSVEGLNKVLSKVANTVRSQVLEEAYQKVPKVVTNQIASQQQMQQKAQDFVAKNQDLFTFGIETKEDLVARQADVVRTVNAIHAENPQYDLDTLYKEAAKEVRQRYKIPKGYEPTKTQGTDVAPKEEEKKREKRKPANPASKGGGRVMPEGEPDPDSFQAKREKVFPNKTKRRS